MGAVEQKLDKMRSLPQWCQLRILLPDTQPPLVILPKSVAGQRVHHHNWLKLTGSTDEKYLAVSCADRNISVGSELPDD
jgi:hypothetical protein